MAKDCPNILLILTEHWRGDSLGRLGHPVAETPHVDELAGQGTTFTAAYTSCPSCIGARRSIMTGLTPNTHGMLGYQDGCPWEYDHTLAGELTRSGYQTLNVGKTHFHPERLHLGFEQLILPADYREWLEGRTGLTRARFANGVHANSWMGRASQLPENEMEETWLTDQAMKRIEKRDPTRPFFLCLSYNGVHPPLCPPQTYFDLFLQKDIPPPVIGEWARAREGDIPDPPRSVNTWQARLSPELNHRARAAYYAYMAYVDAQIGRFMEFLGRRGLQNNTLVLFTADHGEMLGDHHLWRKTYAYDASARIPFIVRPPAGAPGRENALCNALVGQEDILPTLLAYAGVPVPESVEGRSVKPLLADADTPWREVYHHEHAPCYDAAWGYQCLTGKDFKYVWNPTTGAEELFRREDTADTLNLAGEAEYREALETYRTRLARHLQRRPEGFSDGEVLTPAPYTAWREG